jgi:hypothetical protein
MLSRLQRNFTWTESSQLEDVQSKLLTEFPSRQIEIIVLDAVTCFSRETYENSRDIILEATLPALRCMSYQ